jgi:hypothetical protein
MARLRPGSGVNGALSRLVALPQRGYDSFNYLQSLTKFDTNYFTGL